jgi:Fe-S cluster biogenesis protein NfuA
MTMTSPFDARAFQSRMQRLDALLQEAERYADPLARAHTREIAQAVLELHGTALARLLDHIGEAGEAGASVLDACAEDDVVSGLLLLHGLHPHDVEERVNQALERVRPFLRSHGGNVELLSVVDTVVRLRLTGSCHSCPSSTVTMKQSVEEAIYNRAPELTVIEVEGMENSSSPHHNGEARMALPLV